MKNILPLKSSAELHSWSALKSECFSSEWENICLIAAHPCPRRSLKTQCKHNRKTLVCHIKYFRTKEGVGYLPAKQSLFTCLLS